MHRIFIPPPKRKSHALCGAWHTGVEGEKFGAPERTKFPAPAPERFRNDPIKKDRKNEGGDPFPKTFDLSFFANGIFQWKNKSAIPSKTTMCKG